MDQLTRRDALVRIAAAAGTASIGTMGMVRPADDPARTEDVPAPTADHHVHIMSLRAAEGLTPPPASVLETPLPPELAALLRRRELKAIATPDLASQLYTTDAVVRSRRGQSWVRGAINIARALNDFSPGYRLEPIAFGMHGTSGYIVGYLLGQVTGTRRATFHLTLQEVGSEWRIAADDIVVGDVLTPQAVTAEDLIKELDAARIRRATLLSVAYFFASPFYFGNGDEQAAVAAENDWVVGQAQRYPGRLVAFCGVNPLKGYAVQEVERCLRLPLVRGLKLHFGNSEVDLQNPDHVERVRRVFVAANASKLPLVIHLEAGSPSNGRRNAEVFMDRLLPAALDVVVQIAHMAGAGPGYNADAFAVLASARQAGDPRAARLYTDVASVVTSDASPESVSRVAADLRRFGLEHVLFGSDRVPLLANEPPAVAWKSFRRVPLTDAEFETIARNVAPYYTW